MEIKDRTVYSEKEYPYYIFTSDIHGNMNTLPLIRHALNDYPNAQLVGGGDYIDGRKDAKEVCKFLMHMDGVIFKDEIAFDTLNVGDKLHPAQAQSSADSFGHPRPVILNGNHEEMMINFANGLDEYDGGIEPLWYANGGKKTMRSFLGRGYSKPKTARMLRQTEFYRYFRNRPVMYVTPHIIFVHGGIKPIEQFDDLDYYRGINTMETNLNDYDFYRLWSREEYWYGKFSIHGGVFSHNKTNKTIVTGHTPTTFIKGSFDDGRIMKNVPESDCMIRVVKYNDEKPRIFTDGGCHSRLTHNYGNVTVLDSEGNIVKVYDFDHPIGLDWQSYVKLKTPAKIYGAKDSSK